MDKINITSIASRGLKFVLGTLLLISAAATVNAQSVLSVEDIWKQPQLSTPILSPNGKYMAVTMPYKDRMNLTVIDVDTRKAFTLTTYDSFDVQAIRWIGDDRLLYSLGQNNSPTGAGQFDGGGLFVIGRDGKGYRILSDTVRASRAKNLYIHRQFEFFRRIPGNDDEIIASGNMTASNSEDLYRLNLKTGKYTILTQGRPSDLTSGWLMDSKLVPRVVVAGIKDKLTRVVFYRKTRNRIGTKLLATRATKAPHLCRLPLTQMTRLCRLRTTADATRWRYFDSTRIPGKWASCLHSIRNMTLARTRWAAVPAVSSSTRKPTKSWATLCPRPNPK